MMSKKAVVLLSGGLDSLVSVAAANDFCKVELALTFNYSQLAADEEIQASAEIAKYYNIEHKVINLPFLADITNCALSDSNKNIEFDKLDENSAKAVWVPNRNGLFLNIAASYADSSGFDYIIIGANKEEAGTFPDNSQEFLNRAEAAFEYSTLKKPKILAPLKEFEKYEIINLAIEKNAPLHLLKSCYNSKVYSGTKHCGKCESCKRLRDAILKSVNKDLINLFF